MEFFDLSPPVAVQDAEYVRLLGYPRGHELAGRALELAQATRAWYAAHGRPWIYAGGLHEACVVEGFLQVGDVRFQSRKLGEQFGDSGAHAIVCVAVSAGPEGEARAREFWEAALPDEYFFMEMFGSAVVEHLITQAGARICDWAERNAMMVLPHYSPGYSGWDVADQHQLWQLIRRAGDRVLQERLAVLESGMLRPKKSLLAVFGVTRELERAQRFTRLVPCESCSFTPCQYRRAPYQHAPPQIEEVRHLQPVSEAESPASRRASVPLELSANYSVNLRALRKWSKERLTLNWSPDGSVQARFRYEGTTCSSLGRTLAYDYHVELRSAAESYEIAGANCRPAPGDAGHRAQCAYLADAAELERNIAIEKPLLGRPLDEVLAWQRPPNPAGCYCEASSRAHKWGLVLEVIHFALAQRMREQTNGQPAAIPEYSPPPV